DKDNAENKKQRDVHAVPGELCLSLRSFEDTAILERFFVRLIPKSFNCRLRSPESGALSRLRFSPGKRIKRYTI
ncbi:MAG: hypothetical protein K0S07_923, partial [Chlamydiales bacterium]|nr:hypothetical protein [Chlamydiales bacterium]